MTTGPICIYHGHCDDGFAAAWAVRAALGDIEFYPGVYQQEPPDVTGRKVVMVDFSYKRPVLERLVEQAASFTLLDHPKTAAEDLDGLAEARKDVRVYFDMERSGAGMAWDYFHGAPRPEFIDYIEDRDLWRKRLPGVDEFTIALRSYPQDFEVWDGLVAAGPAPLIAEGRAIGRYYRLRCEELKRSAYRASLCGCSVWIANAPYFAASEVAGELAERDGFDFGACYFEVSEGRWQYSLRSREGFDVSQIARAFGGGGHAAAAGFTVDAPVHLSRRA